MSPNAETKGAVAAGDGDKGDFKDKQFAENEVADKVVEQCKCSVECVVHRDGARSKVGCWCGLSCSALWQ